MKTPLEKFVERANRLKEREFIKAAVAIGDVRLDMSWKQGDPRRTVTTNWTVGEDLLLAFANDLRFFIQKNEETSFVRMNGRVRSPPYSVDFERVYRAYVDAWNAYLDEQPTTNFKVTKAGEIIIDLPTRRQQLDVVMYGELVHSTQEGILKAVREDELAYQMLRHEVYFVMVELYNVIQTIANACRVELNRIDGGANKK